MERSIALALTSLAWVWPVAVAVGACDGKPQATSPPGTQAARPGGQPWLTDLVQGQAEAVRLRRPILVRLGAEWCPWCRKLDAEFARPEVQHVLGSWTLVALDVDKDQAAAESLGAATIPALRVMTPAGRLVASRDGFLTAGELIAWLGEHQARAAGLPLAELADSGAPGAVSVVRLVRQLDQTDALLREAAINRLENYPREAAAPVVAAFAAGSLQARLAALELLRAWNAPVDGLDPWRPATVTEGRLKALRDWSTKLVSPAAPPVSAPTSPTTWSLTPAQLADAGREVDRLLGAEPADAAAIRERLARLGRALLPVVRDRTSRVETDAARERLTALRYRLTASSALVLKWPGGLDQLSATDVATRHRAVDELVELAGPGDEPLLLKLFNDPDPLVRETALRGLDAIGNAGDSQALVALLADPEPNVRAAVLKQLAEHPAPRLATALADYVAHETDPDLVAHAVRVLRELNGSKPLKILIGLLKHENWSVRAEAVEGIGKLLETYPRSDNSTGTAGEASAALTERLDDPDGFVVGRVLTAMQDMDLAEAVDPLFRAAEKHPELAAKVIEKFSGSMRGDQAASRRKARPFLRKLVSHPRPEVRGAVITALSDPTAQAIEPEVQHGLSDLDSPVRIAAAQVILAKLQAMRPQKADSSAPGRPSTETAVNDGATAKGTDKTPENPFESWLTRFQEGKEHPSWTEPAISRLVKMLAAPAGEERLAAALPLVALGRDQAAAVAALLDVARRRPDLAGNAAQALPWLHWPDRLDLFRKLLATNPDPDELSQLAGQLASVRDARAAQALWDLTGRGELSPQAAFAIDSALRQGYFGMYGFDLSRISMVDRRRAAADLSIRAKSGPEWQRVIALTLLLSVVPDDARAAARSIVDDLHLPASLRRDAFQVLLLSGDRAQGPKEALDALRGRDLPLQNVALRFLISDDSLYVLRERMFLWAETPAANQFRRSPDNPLAPPIPTLSAEVRPDLLRPFLNAGDPETAALAGFALALLGEAEGLKPLLSYWRKQPGNDQAWNQRAYQAIAQLDDDSQVPVLEQIYAKARSASGSSAYNQRIDIKDFYWTIRVMDGPNARRLRQRIRREVGMSFLRGEQSQAMQVS